MKMPAALAPLAARFDAMSLRERVLVSVAILVVVFMVWDSLFMQPLANEKTRLTQQLTETSQAIEQMAASLQSGTGLSPMNAALNRHEKLKASLAKVDAELASASAGFVPPEMMTQVVRDVLARQHGLKLISLHNGAVTSLVPPPDPKVPGSAPFIHPVDLVIEGSYLDVLEYLRALEALPWRFYWKNLELNAVEYPTNRVHIELSTLSMEKDWLGV